MSEKDWRNGLDWKVFVRDKYTCRYCGLSISALNGAGHVNRWDMFRADHLKARKGKDKAGNLDTVMNLVTACAGCNAIKGYTFDRAYDGPAPQTLEDQQRLVQQANEHIKAGREKLVSDAIQMQREAGLL
ncbi:MAG TPA: HNH endonuclease [Candidatus Baltobacteraceae bacterium]|jgi:hypothetical protein|nr:HNH endonuclease [Candidatus Baltobacteraceae bacterium]